MEWLHPYLASRFPSIFCVMLGSLHITLKLFLFKHLELEIVNLKPPEMHLKKRYIFFHRSQLANLEILPPAPNQLFTDDIHRKILMMKLKLLIAAVIFPHSQVIFLSNAGKTARALMCLYHFHYTYTYVQPERVHAA